MAAQQRKRSSLLRGFEGTPGDDPQNNPPGSDWSPGFSGFNVTTADNGGNLGACS